MEKLKRITALCVMLAVLACSVFSCGEVMTTSKKQNLFNAALGELEAYLMDLKDDPAHLNAIVKQFGDLGGFPQSRQFWYYTNVLLKVTAAEFDMALNTYLYTLSQMPEFDDYIASLGNTPIGSTTKLTAYARGREAEYKNDIDTALTYYSQCMGFYDAMDRYNGFVMGNAEAAFARGMEYLNANDPAAAYIQFKQSGAYGEAQAMLAAIEAQIGYAPENAQDNPGSVQSVSAQNAASSSVTLSWEAAAHAMSYAVEYRKTGDAAWTNAGSTADTSYTVDGLATDTAYDFRVTAYANIFATAGAELKSVLTAASAPKIKVGDTVTFGAYEQDNDTSNGKEPIEWEVLDIESDGTCLLISRYALDARPYNKDEIDVTWETCTLRSWLKNSFYNSAFNTNERSKIVITRNKNENNPVAGTKGGNDTSDYVFLLSLEEIQKYYSIDKNTGEDWRWDGEERLMKYPTAYAKAQDVWLSDPAEDGTGASVWWLRSPGSVSVRAVGADWVGGISVKGGFVHSSYFGVVPAVRVRLLTDESEQTDAAALPCSIGDTVTFGSYEQDNDTSNGKEPIEWIVLKINGDGSMVLLSKYALDCKPYSDTYTDVKWETCSLRNWLNEDFYNDAFSAAEQAKIKTTNIVNESNPKYDTWGGKDTQDKVWLLSINEVTDYYAADKVYGYFDGNTSRMCAPTEYAAAQGVTQSSRYLAEGAGACVWWLRSPGRSGLYYAIVNDDGGVPSTGFSINYGNAAVRPVIVVLP